MEIKIIPFQCLVVNKFYWCLNNSTYLEWALKRKICIKLQLAFPQHTAREGRGGGGDFIFGTRVMGNIFVAGQIQKRRIILKKK
jgi:hypothetical protein